MRGRAGPLQMMIRRDRPFEKGHPKGAGLLQMIIRRAAAVRGGIGDSSSCMKIDFFLCKIRFRTHRIIVFAGLVVIGGDCQIRKSSLGRVCP